VLNGAVGFAMGGFDFRDRSGGFGGIGAEEAIGEGSAHALVEEDEEQSDAGSLIGEAVGVAATVALQQPVSFELAQVVAQLVSV